MPRLWAISDLHVAYQDNQRLVEDLPAHPGDWLILAGDVGESMEHLRWTLDRLAPRFQRLIWVPGNHELWTTRDRPQLRGEAKYQRLVDLCREYDVLTPEDPYPVFESSRGPIHLVPLFLLYDYSFCPAEIGPQRAREWALEQGLRCADEVRIEPSPHATIRDWCHARVEESERRLASLDDELPTVLINHFPLRYKDVWLPRIPRFSIWCGSRLTETWHVKYRAQVVVTGHLHMRRSHDDDGVRFEEVSVGYPRERQRKRLTAEHALVPVLT